MGLEIKTSEVVESISCDNCNKPIKTTLNVGNSGAYAETYCNDCFYDLQEELKDANKELSKAESLIVELQDKLEAYSKAATLLGELIKKNEEEKT